MDRLVQSALMVRVFWHDDKDLPELASMWVKPQARGGDAAPRLISEVLTWAATEGVPGVYLTVLANNIRAKRLYERLGFISNGISHHLPDGRVEIELEHRFNTATAPHS